MVAGQTPRPSLATRFKAFFIWLIARLLLATVRLRVLHAERLALARESGGPLLFAFWHGRQLALFKANPERELAVMTSLSRDGQMQSLVCRRFGLQVVRGSSSRAALTGLLALGRKLRAGVSIGLAVDGPKGPVFEAKPGICALAQQADMPIVPITVGFASSWLLSKTWDQFRIPKPFTRAVVAYGEPIRLARRADTKARDDQALGLSTCLCDLTAEVDAVAGKR
jgi:lysophospholipid acyltransferase (LPLAT)-like uncharacterized protein